MLYFANPSTPKVREAMTAGLLGCIATPRSGQDRVPPEVDWCADNGCFGKGYPGDDRWWAWLTTHAYRDRCRFAVAPDVVADAAATSARSRPWLPRIRDLGVPAAFVVQNGQESLPVPWDEFDVMFIGGSTEWKIGPAAAALASSARARGKRVHMGRVNSLRRLRYAEAIGCDSADGTFITYGPDVNLPRALGWLTEVRDQPCLNLTDTPGGTSL